nr:RNA-directed DNA polymerase, eukaryota [Tanacetum cinerariifolium]
FKSVNSIPFSIQSSISLKHDLPLKLHWANDPEKLGTAPDLIERLCAPIQQEDDKLFRKPAYMEYTRLEFWLKGLKSHQSLGSDDKVKWVKELCVVNKPYVLGIHETKMQSINKGIIENMWGSDSFRFVAVDARGSLGGILFVCDDAMFTNNSAMEGEGFLAVIGSWKDKSGLAGFINVYAPQDVNLKTEI